MGATKFGFGMMSEGDLYCCLHVDNAIVASSNPSSQLLFFLNICNDDKHYFT